ncbi:MAG TPA: kelch repeat-containing protein [Polyangia bacterium]|nr:kelch repeat-containing protein [Polyangia bacterium]
MRARSAIPVLLALVLAGCGQAPAVVLARRLAARDPELRERLSEQPGVWERAGEKWTSPGWRSARMGPFYEVGARLPERADGPLEVGIGQSERYRLHLFPEGAGGAAVEEQRGRAVYREAWRSTDALFVASAHRVEWCLLLRSARAPSSFTWRVELPSGLPRVRSEPSGGLAWLDEGGNPRLRMPRPFALDAHGQRRDAAVSFEGDRLRVALDVRGLAFPVLLDPALESALWLQVAGPPAARYAHAVVYDSARARTVVFGGWTGSALGDTWEWNGTVWTQVASTGPGARYGHAMAFDATRGRTVLFGGYDGNPLGDTWLWDGSSWTRAATTGPAPRLYPALAFDSARGRTVLFGGAPSSSAVYGDTWEWDGMAWTQVSSSGPAPRRQAALAFDSTRNQSVLYGGWNGTSSFGDTWVWNGSTWSQSSSTGPSARSRTALAYDRTRDRMVLFGGFDGNSHGDTWEWNGSAWMQVASTGPSARDWHGLAWDAARGRTVLFGGFSSASGPLGDTWEWNGSAWSPASAASGPPARAFSALAFDSTRNRSVLFGGSVTGVYLGDTWEWDGTIWAQVASTGPPGRNYHTLVFDGAHTMVFGGLNLGGVLGDTWLWNGNTWTQGPAGPSARANHGAAFDSARGRAVLFGGGTNTGNAGDTWEWDGGAWMQVLSSGPSARNSHSMAYDVARSRTVLFGGTDNTTRFADTWLWNGSSWTQVATTGPTARTLAAMAFDVSWGRVVLYGGSTPGYLGDEWLWDGSSWSTAPANPPFARQAAAMTYDSARRRMVLFGGFDDYYLGDTWEQHTRGGPCTSPTQCDTGRCVDGVCCETACDGVCKACNLSPTPGECTSVVGAQDPDTCAGSQICGPSGQCGLPNGQPCTAGVTVCASGLCVDGFCCDQPCAGSCDACNGAMLGFAGAQNGICATAPSGYPGSPSCGAYACTGGSPSCTGVSCAGNANCNPGYFCFMSVCTALLPNGQSCSAGAQCQSANCVDGVCCDTSCPGACNACNVMGHVGACFAVPAGQDLRGLCPGSGPCKAVCSASGLCAYPDATRACAPAACVGPSMPSILHRASSCDGNGTCVDRGTLDCAPYNCAGGSCPSACTSSGQCAGGNLCQGGSCGQHRAPGQACSVRSDCELGFCVDGVCCQEACGGPCRRCDRTPGVCTVPVGEDPDGDCPGEGLCRGTCAADRSCNYPGAERACDTCKACDRSGHCNQAPASGDDPACLVIPCGALSRSCRTYHDLSSMRCVAVGACALPNDPASCTDFVNAPDGEPCAGGQCRGGVCVSGVDGGAGSGGSGASNDGGCAAAGVGASPGAGVGAVWLLYLALLTLPARRSGRPGPSSSTGAGSCRAHRTRTP